MKKLSTLLLCTALWSHSFAKTVDVNAAKTIGYSFLNRNAHVSLPNGANNLQAVYTATTDINGTSTPCFYVFNTPVKGFVIVSADDNVLPILGYSSEAAFGITNIPTHVKWWMDNYTQQIAYVIKNNVAAEKSITKQWNSLSSASATKSLAKTTDVSPLLTTTWDQNPRYNALCPGTGAQQSVTGCVATAMAQVMNFWNWPAVGSGANSYTPDSVASYGVQSANFGATTYDWSSMAVAELSATTTTAQNTAIATLMYHCGVSVDMNYNTAAHDGSGAYVERLQTTRTSCAEYALKAYFKYSPSLHGDLRSQYSSTAAWVSALETDLDAGHPVLYTGQGSDGGHCWVADGYQVNGATTTIHFNWGWSGQSNGYFTVDNLAPPALGTGGGNGNFNSDQGAIFGIKPDTIAASTDGMKLNAVINVPNSLSLYTQSFSFTANILNSTGASFTGDITAEIFDQNNNLITTVPAATNITIANNGNSGALTFTPSTQNLFLMVPGIYVIRMYYRTTGGNWTLVGDNGSIINYATTGVADDDGILLNDSINCSEGRILQIGQPVSVTTSIVNFTGSDFTAGVDASLWDAATQQEVFDIQQLPNTTLSGSGNPQQFTFTSTNNLNIAEGTYVLMIAIVQSNNFSPVGSLYYQNPVLVQVPAKASVNNVAAQGMISVYPNPATDVVNVNLNGRKANMISMLDMQGRVVTNVTPSNNIVAVPVHDLAPGIYIMQIHTDTEVITQKINVTK